jgi:hypothetical protein
MLQLPRFPPLQQFFESLNPLHNFDGKEALETYLFDQSHKVEPKNAEKMEIVVIPLHFYIAYHLLEETLATTGGVEIAGDQDAQGAGGISNAAIPGHGCRIVSLPPLQSPLQDESGSAWGGERLRDCGDTTG